MKSLRTRIIAWARTREPNERVIVNGEVYLRRWHVIARNRFFNIYVHRFSRSDDDRALHDHPWASLSWVLRGRYIDITSKGGKLLTEGKFKLRLSGKKPHRVVLIDDTCWTLFVTGPKYREWGFHCPKLGWTHWKKFLGVTP